MCFSASASFGAGMVLSVITVVSIKKLTMPSQLAFAVIPFAFCVQQITEGFLWLALADPTYAPLKQTTTYMFLFFAQVVWPVLVPFAIFKMEKNSKRKRILKVLVLIGSIVSVYLAYCLYHFHVEAKIIGMHISYKENYPDALDIYCGPLYVIATIAPAFFSSTRRMWMMGSTILISYIITYILYTDYIVSVWCFFASLISILVAVILYQLKKAQKEHPRQPIQLYKTATP